MKFIQENVHDLGLAFLRILAGVGMAYHGYGKVFGGHIEGFTQGVAKMGFPAPEFFAWMAALSELLGGACLALGLFTRIAALFVFGTMTVAAFIAHGSDPLQKKELALAYWAIFGAFMGTGPGRFSLDHLIGKKK